MIEGSYEAYLDIKKLRALNIVKKRGAEGDCFFFLKIYAKYRAAYTSVYFAVAKEAISYVGTLVIIFSKGAAIKSNPHPLL